MRLELLGDKIENRPPFHGVTWTLWLEDNYAIARGTAASKVKAEQQANRAFERFKRALVHRKKPLRWQEY